MLLIRKPSISMGHGFHGYVSHNQRVHIIYISYTYHIHIIYISYTAHLVTNHSFTYHPSYNDPAGAQAILLVQRHKQPQDVRDLVALVAVATLPSKKIQGTRYHTHLRTNTEPPKKLHFPIFQSEHILLPRAFQFSWGSMGFYANFFRDGWDWQGGSTGRSSFSG